MAPVTLSTAYFLCLLAATANSLSCIPCGDNECPDVPCPKGVTVVKDECGCCDVCSKQRGEKCGGSFDIFGVCDPNKSLVCTMDEPTCDLDFNLEPVPGPEPSPYGKCQNPLFIKIIEFYCSYWQKIIDLLKKLRSKKND
uniref:CCN family member 2-like n=1 Tax=Styela clava TaxID=7725 RepID=UPI0019399278|nr:CCN family member 2-like [Styela clava]